MLRYLVTMINPGGYALEDTILRNRIRQIIHDHKIEVIVETGVNEGRSTVEFGCMSNDMVVVGIDNDSECLKLTSHKITSAGMANRIALFLGNSPDVLRNIMPLLPDRTLYFLDAHWESYWPLRDEITAIRSGTGVIAIHDMKVPDHPELGWDAYRGQPVGTQDIQILSNDPTIYRVEVYQRAELDYAYVKEVLTKWSPTHKIEYNEKAECSQPRGVGFVFSR
jgi:predicted O-methyltransferase YrrM